jgi:hypothetical protein
VAGCCRVSATRPGHVASLRPQIGWCDATVGLGGYCSGEVMFMAPWQAIAQREWGMTATWIKGDGQYAVLHPCGEELTVTLCATPTEAKDAKVYRCGGRCTRSRHTVMDLRKAFGVAALPD